MRKFQELLERMSPEAQAEVKRRAEELMRQLDEACPTCSAKGWIHGPDSPCLSPPTEPLTPEIEAAIDRAVDDVLITPPPGVSYRQHRTERLRAFAREIQENAEFAKGCECDSCCRLEELRVKVHLPEGSADEIAGSIGDILDGQLESLQALWPLQDQAAALAEALEKVTERMDRAGGDRDGMPECPWCRCGPDGDNHSPGCELDMARAALSSWRARDTGAEKEK